MAAPIFTPDHGCRGSAASPPGQPQPRPANFERAVSCAPGRNAALGVAAQANHAGAASADGERPLVYFGGSSSGRTASRHLGWTYVLVVTGGLKMIEQRRTGFIASPALVVLGPGSDLQWEPEDAESSRLAVWKWENPVHEGIRRLDPAGFTVHHLTASDVASLRHLHALCREELFREDPDSAPALVGIQLILETQITRIWNGEASDPRKEMLGRALTWIATHFSARQPLAELAEFLGVSTATVQRLFRQHLGTTVMKKVSEQRRLEAERMLLSKRASVKEIAFHLGYRHPHDFTRAYRKSTGGVPSQQLLKAG